MGFEIYRIQPLEGGRFALHKTGLLPLGGSKGILARHLPALAALDEQWSLAPAELLRWAGVAEAPSHGVFFNLTPGAAQQVNLFELVSVSGRTVSLLTDALFHFKVACASRNRAEIEGENGEWIVPDWRGNPARFEHLRLAGGTRGGSWAWSEPPQSASATVI
ncbi:MAG: hypothetical protein PHQ12_00605 [Chthoniobacteraceae bacterium]|nr:hypothetical protein [Chthoniobacteraceae bacterium]